MGDPTALIPVPITCIRGKSIANSSLLPEVSFAQNPQGGVLFCTKSSGTISRGGEKWVLGTQRVPGRMGPAPRLHNSSGQQVQGAGVETLAWTSLSLPLGHQDLSLHGVDCHRAVPVLARCPA